MKRVVSLLALLVLSCLTLVQLSAQCTPDTACVDTEDPGEFCPENLPYAGLNVPYDEVVTVIPPAKYIIPDYGFEVSILYIDIDSVKNLPPGISYSPNATRMFPDTAYCIQLQGTPTQVGDYPLSIYITATADLGVGGIVPVQVKDSTSVVITVVEVLGIDPNQLSDFYVNQNAPNPFSTVTRLAYYTPAMDRVELKVYNLLGVLVHQESRLVSPGAHYFEFDGAFLEPGIYIYKAESGEALSTGKMMKSR